MDWLASAASYDPYANSGSGVLGEKDATSVFDALLQQQNGMETLSNQFLQTGIDHYQNKKYKEAAKLFESSIGLSPNSSYNVDTSKYLVQSYLKLGQNDKAFNVYKKAIERNPDRDDLRSALGKLYYAEDRYAEVGGTISGSREGQPQHAQIGILSAKPCSKSKTTAKPSISSAKSTVSNRKAMPVTTAWEKCMPRPRIMKRPSYISRRRWSLEPTFYEALAEIGYTYADMGEIENARETEERLEALDEALSSTLRYYINEKEPPRIAFAFSTSSFPYSMSKGYAVSAIGSYLENGGAQKSVTMEFLFTKDMDPVSVENRFNWNISRALSDNIAKTYNFGDVIPATEISLDPYPDYVIYDKNSQTATVGFTLRQNESADGTIDPSHIIFKFDGEDIYGVSMDQDGDEYSGFSRSA